jgi:8-oxo-dGTP pyrophosphatase MutT (NUDIX family)
MGIARKVRAWREAEDDGRWISAGGVVFRDDKIALVKQRGRNGDKRWTFPKGRVDPGETIQQAAQREVYEESGLQARIVSHIGAWESSRKIVHYFVMHLARAGGRFDREETFEVRFVEVRRARKLLSSKRDRNVLKRALDVVLGLR